MNKEEIKKRLTHYITDENGNKWEVIEVSDLDEILQSPQSDAVELIEYQREYIQLLKDELDDVVPVAFNYGWVSKRAKKGEKMRKKMLELYNKWKEEQK